MKLLRLPAYFLPEQMSSTHLQKDRLEFFSKAGIETIVIAPTPTRGLNTEEYKKYKDVLEETLYDGKVKIHRFRLMREGKNPFGRFLRYLLCNIKQYFLAIKEKDIDIIYSSSTPPIQGILCVLVKRRLEKKYQHTIPIIYNLQDIFPDSLVNTGMTKKGSILWKIGRIIENFTYRNADKIIVISEGFKKNIMKKGCPEEKIEVIPNWVDISGIKSIPRQLNPLVTELSINPSKFIVLYAGNFGRAQGADIVLKAARRLIDEDKIQFVIFGGGSEFQDALRYVKQNNLTNVIIKPLLPQERVSEVYSLGDVAIITCKEGFGASCVPSKTWSIMACETSILASFDLNSELCQLIQKVQCGVCILPSNVEKLTSKIIELSRNNELLNNGIKGRQYLEKYINKEICLEKYIKIIFNCIHYINI